MLLALLASTAFAASTKIPAGKADIASAVEVPLYAGVAPGDPYVYVEAKVGETALLLRVSTSTSGIHLSDAAAGALKLKANEKTSAASLDRLSIGSANFTGLTVYVGGLANGHTSDYGVDGEIGIGAFPGLSWEILRSTGKLKIGPGAAGAAWVSELGGAMPFLSNPNKKLKIGKEQVEIESAPIIVNLSWDGVSVPTELVTAGPTVLYREADTANRWWSIKGMDIPSYALPKAPSIRTGESVQESRTITVGGRAEPTIVSRQSAGPAYPAKVPGQLGVDVLMHYDMAIDGAGASVALKPITASGLADYRPTYEAALRKDLEPAPAKDGKAPDPEAAKAAKAAALKPLAEWLNKSGKVTDAMAAAKERAELAPDDCTAWQDYGNYALDAAMPNDAVTAFAKAGALYEPWASKSLETRTQLKKDFDAAKKAKTAYDGVIPQDHACYTAWGQLASAYIQSGHPEKVAELYPAKLDLDDGLATAAGVAALVKGDAVAAEAAFRQALFLDPRDEGAARQGLFLALSNRTLANAQLERNGQLTTSSLNLSMYAEAIRKLDGGAKAIAAVKALADTMPHNPIVAIELARQYQKDGNTDAAAGLLKQAHAALEGWGGATSSSTNVRSAWALLQLAEGQPDAAKATADALTASMPGEGIGWWTASVIAASAGDTAKSAEYLRKAGVVASGNPLLAVAAAN